MSAVINGKCGKCGGPRDSKQYYCRSCAASYARIRRQSLAREGKRCWTNTKCDREQRSYTYFGPGWMLPRVIATITASIVWGRCGSMADMPEY